MRWSQSIDWSSRSCGGVDQERIARGSDSKPCTAIRSAAVARRRVSRDVMILSGIMAAVSLNRRQHCDAHSRRACQFGIKRHWDIFTAPPQFAQVIDVPVLRYFVNIRQSTSGGDTTLMRGRTKGTGANPYLNVHGGGYRGVYDFADPDSSVFILSTGQSGHPLSRHYDDLGELWRRGEYIPMSLDPELARAAAVGITVLTPVQ